MHFHCTDYYHHTYSRLLWKYRERIRGVQAKDPSSYRYTDSSLILKYIPIRDTLSGPISPRYCDTIPAIPYIARCHFREVSAPPKWDTQRLVLSFTQGASVQHPIFATYSAIIVRYTIKINTKLFCDAIDMKSIVAGPLSRYSKEVSEHGFVDGSKR